MEKTDTKDETKMMPDDEMEILETPVERESWGNRMEFMLSCVGYAVGLGNVWRFPYICYRSGGGAFLIPFTFFLLVAGIPLFFFELSFGQYSSSGAITVWKCVPLMSGIGYCMAFVCFIVSLYYNVIIAWCLYYLYHSFSYQLPWASCGNSWNTDSCLVQTGGTCNVSNGSIPCNTGIANPTSPADEFFHNKVLDISSGIEEWGSMKLHLVICLFIAWMLVYAVLVKGIQSLGKVSYFTAVFPYILLTTLLIMALTLPGSYQGIMFYVTPDFNKLYEPSVWKDAAGQVFFSFGIGWGCLIAFSSYNKLENNCFRDAIIVSLMDWFTSLFAGFVIFAVIGFMAHEQGTDVESSITEGPGLAFIAYPTIVTRLPFPQLWSVLFFFMLVVLGCDTQFAIVESVVTALSDRFPSTLRRHKSLTTLCLCITWFILGLSMCTQGGLYWLVLLDTYAAGMNLLIAGIAELLAVSWIYGGERFCEDIEFMLKYRISRGWKIMWGIITPFALTFVLIVSVAKYERPKVGGHVYPIWGDVLGWSLVITAITLIPCTAIINICQSEGTIPDRIRQLVQPSSDWGPEERRFGKYQEKQCHSVALGNIDSAVVSV